MPRVSALISYPVKGCAGAPLNRAVSTPAGLPHDRAFMVVDAEGVFRSQRGSPRLALIRPGVEDDGAHLLLQAPGTGTARIPVLAEGPRTGVTMHGRPFEAVDQGEEAARWLTDVLGEPSRLVRVAPGHDRTVNGHFSGTSAFADSSAALVLSLSSLDLLNARLAEAGAPALPMDRFRPNIVVSGWPEPHTEDGVLTMRIGGTGLGFSKPCKRCAVTTVDQETGEKAGPEPLRTLASYRRWAEGGVVFGAKFAVLDPGPIAVGDEVEVDEWAGPERALVALAGEEEAARR
ncbi:MOSC domain-containing protein [Nocardiopsis suaedae]|uniref:MOSC domain-containing protein n=1 Tax=Nocardiopsis suaedae TaxID=3018444 RepID=A0ABT4TPX6_9ACTN|nr:MOSC N-terminal beta barrel domain-containing protein [Nocardiopsis suaedae]MDA2806738.1 MOSC domain-containing protein [Nocardiopsis suaedae]